MGIKPPKAAVTTRKSYTVMMGLKNKWFAFDLSYDWGMTGSIQYSGNIAGQRWKSAGDNKERAYGYGNDQANRLPRADFTQNNSGWAADPILNFSMLTGDGTTASIVYNENGNILKMKQYGLAGVSSTLIDSLTYTYANSGVSNKLLQVKDNATQPTVNLGDFNDKNSSGNDYGYDVKGNLITDLNKGMNGTTGTDHTNTGSNTGVIVYNHLNLPWKITVKNNKGELKGTITYIYDALGNKLEKRTSEAISAYNSNVAKQTQTAYIGSFVYENNVLQFAGMEEGRVRLVQSVVNNGDTALIRLRWEEHRLCHDFTMTLVWRSPGFSTISNHYTCYLLQAVSGKEDDEHQAAVCGAA